MATETRRLSDGTVCTHVTVQDEENEVRVHIHEDDLWPIGLRVTSATLGVIVETGDVGDCDE